MTDATKSCPSAVGKKGASLLGVVNEQGTIDILKTPLPVNQKFLEIAKQGRSLEKRFRFSNKCIESGCKQWTGSRCQVIDNVLTALENVKTAELQACALRTSCRWFSQSGVAACTGCKFVVTELEA